MATMFEKMKAAIETMKAEQIKAEVARIKAEKAKRYEYHKKYNATKKAYEQKLLEKANSLNLIK